MTAIATQTFGLWNEFSKGMAGTIQELHNIGFNAIEPAVIFVEKQGKLPLNIWAVETLKIAADKMLQLGMTIPSVHMFVAFGRLSMPVSIITKAMLMIHEEYGIQDFVISGMFNDLTGAKHFAKLVRRISDTVYPYGCRVLFHNHDDEFRSVCYKGNTITALDAFLDMVGNDVMLQIDIGWAGMAGDEKAIVEKYADRIVSLHLKDFYDDYRNGNYSRKNLPTEAFAPIGEGTVATREILAMRNTLPNFNGSIIIDQDKSSMDMLRALEIGFCNVCNMLSDRKLNQAEI